MANTTTTFVKNIQVTYNGVNYLLDADLDINLDTGDVVAVDSIEGWVCDCYWESVAPKTSNLTYAEFEGFQDAIREASKHHFDLFDIRQELEDL